MKHLKCIFYNIAMLIFPPRITGISVHRNMTYTTTDVKAKKRVGAGQTEF